MHDSKVDFTNLFRSLGLVKVNTPIKSISIRDEFIDRPAIDKWLEDYIERLKLESSHDHTRKLHMDAVNPKYILRNHLAQIAIEKAQHKDFSEIAILLKILESPYEEQEAYSSYATPPSPDLSAVEVSCSS